MVNGYSLTGGDELNWLAVVEPIRGNPRGQTLDLTNSISWVELCCHGKESPYRIPGAIYR